MTPLSILAHVGDDFVCVEKPPCVLVIPGRNEPATQCLQFLLQQQLARRVWVVHRLDRDTSGIVLFALNAEAHRRASMAFEHGEVQKEYLALSRGHAQAAFEANQPLAAGRKGRNRVAASGEGKAARTRFELVETLRDASLLRAFPLTGRQHQIRVHLQALGHPLLIDPLYGEKESAEAPMLQRTPLHAARLQIPTLQVSASSPLPLDMAITIEHLKLEKQ
jgi:RluA family pseudouridine synthase